MFKKAFKYLVFIITAHSRKGHGVHSPFVFKLVSGTIKCRKDETLTKVLKWRRNLEKEKNLMQKAASGAGSVAGNKGTIEAGTLVRLTGLPHKYGELIYRLVKEFQPETIIELGTGLGISTAYLASASPKKTVVSIEGSTERAAYAEKSLKKLNFRNTTLLTGDFEEHFQRLLEVNKHPIFILIDGNHLYEPTIKYFDLALKYVNEDSIIIFDDIHWSPAMEKAWKYICDNKKVVVSIDFYRCGLIFFRKGMLKQHYLINY